MGYEDDIHLVLVIFYMLFIICFGAFIHVYFSSSVSILIMVILLVLGIFIVLGGNSFFEQLYYELKWKLK